MNDDLNGARSSKVKSYYMVAQGKSTYDLELTIPWYRRSLDIVFEKRLGRICSNDLVERSLDVVFEKRLGINCSNDLVGRSPDYGMGQENS
ncbi:hypothetical protein L1987_06255 [Smallanthus sonchifolius]|uniref:Uncharacterized protein n=1 Tax=Smallanthus sonchifolius TaxID=185202 RepID=A0ACB9JXN2_9ASTR|nr:hypothetical protein L1987_06255 [Smallanthus sonchifolius]